MKLSGEKLSKGKKIPPPQRGHSHRGTFAHVYVNRSEIPHGDIDLDIDRCVYGGESDCDRWGGPRCDNHRACVSGQDA